MTSIQQFTIRPGGFTEIRKTILLRALPIILLAALTGIAISYFNNREQGRNLSTLPFSISLLLAVVVFGFYRAINRQKKLFESYRIRFEQHCVLREQDNTPTITIPYTHIREISKNANGSFTIKGDSMVNFIGVPAQIEEYEKLEAILTGIQPLTIQTSEPVMQKFMGLIALPVLGLMATVYLATNKLLVGLSGVVLLLSLGYSFFAIQRSKHFDHKTKRGAWWSILVVASIIAVMYYKLSV